MSFNEQNLRLLAVFKMKSLVNLSFKFHSQAFYRASVAYRVSSTASLAVATTKALRRKALAHIGRAGPPPSAVVLRSSLYPLVFWPHGIWLCYIPSQRANEPFFKLNSQMLAPALHLARRAKYQVVGRKILSASSKAVKRSINLS